MNCTIHQTNAVQTKSQPERKRDMTTNEEIETQIQGELLAWLTEERKRLQDMADNSKVRLEGLIAERKTAQKEYAGLVKELEAKRKTLETLPDEITELEGRVIHAENIKDDDETGSYSRIKAARQDFERAQYQAQSFVAQKMDEMKRQIQA